MFSNSLPLVDVIPSRLRLIPLMIIRGSFLFTSCAASASRETNPSGSSLTVLCSFSRGTSHSTPDIGNRVLSPTRRTLSPFSISSILFLPLRTASRNSSNPTMP